MSRYPEFCLEYLRFASFHSWIPPDREWIFRISADGYFLLDHHIVCFSCGEERPNHAQNCQRRQLNVPFSNVSQAHTTTTASDCLVHPGELNITLRPRNQGELFTAMNITSSDRFVHPGELSITLRGRNQEEVFAAMNITPRPRQIQGQSTENQANLPPAQLGDRGYGDVCLHLRTGGNSSRTDSPANSRHRTSSLRSHHLAQFAPAQQGSYTGQTLSIGMASGEGMSSATTGAASASTSQAPLSNPCHRCRQNSAEMIFQPCGHLVYCKGCASAETYCRVCGEAIQYSFQLYHHNQ